MLIVISPAKTLDFSPQSLHKTTSKPELLTQSKKLIALLRKLSPKQLGKLMSISDKLSAGVHEYVADWKAKYDTTTAKQSLLAFRGDVYLGIDADSFSTKDFDFAQKHLRILSGLYGVLRPLDLMQAYRLEMGTKLLGEHGKDLYTFWGGKIARNLKKALAEQDDDVLVNLASNEYFKATHAKAAQAKATQAAATQVKRLDCRVITPVFKDRKGSDYKVISFFAKKARGMMAGYLIRNRITDENGILQFRQAGYKYHRGLSSHDQPVFTRPQAQ